MDQYIMKGQVPLSGEVFIAGAKNAALGIVAAAIMADEPVHVDNIPAIGDIQALIAGVKETGASVVEENKHRWMINGSTLHSVTVESGELQKIRGGYYLIGALLGKCHKAEVVMPGGCNLGARPIDQHLKGFRALGAKVEIRNGKVYAECERLVGNHVYFDVSSVGATINVMLAASLAEGKTILDNAAKEPHVVDVANFLNSMGAKIKGAGTDLIRIEGVPKLHGTDYSIIPDQIEAGTFMVAAAATRGDVVVRNVIPKHLESISSKLREIGCEVVEGEEEVRVVGTNTIQATNIKTLPYPGFPTDMQPQIAATLALATGTSIISETVFDARFRYVNELNRMGACISVERDNAIIVGPQRLTGATVNASDLRAGAALVIAGLCAEGYTTVCDIEHIERGYEDFLEKLQSLGAVIERVAENDTRAKTKFRMRVS
ncbi:MAG: UDP-N-acetylglucosamine 1-carboxyvinyltransferase [Lachnospiraceae bacterium]|nr:UDP-N-acetylglucosamine 1-carboxyvinyltransferase [Lachnospiraceae bacterium]